MCYGETIGSSGAWVNTGGGGVDFLFHLVQRQIQPQEVDPLATDRPVRMGLGQFGQELPERRFGIGSEVASAVMRETCESASSSQIQRPSSEAGSATRGLK